MLRAGGIAYEHHPGGARSRGRPPLLLIHGAAGSRLFWPSAIRRLEGVEVYALDLPGHGASGGEAQPTIEGYVSSVAKWIEAAGLSRVVCAGHSMGGAIALALALRSPDALAGLILVGTTAALRVNPVLLQLSDSLATYRKAVELIVEWSFGSQAPPRLLELAGRRMGDVPARVLHADLEACSRFDVASQIPSIALPSLVICGSEDRMTPPKLSQALGGALPRSELRLVEGAGHMVMLEQPEGVAASIRHFLEATFPLV
jgi:pimeloyl-ACP methyl ester carboxylesterase